MLLHGRPFVPPGCPARTGVEFDLYTADFDLYVGSTGDDDSRGIEIFAHFSKDEDSDDVVESGSLIFSPDSEVARAAGRLVEYGDSVEQLRGWLCDRIANCHGVVEGECWALGRTALGEIILEIAREQS